MNLNKINIKELVQGEYTYPNWSTGSIYSLKTKELTNDTLVYYFTKSNREVSRIFPKEIDLTPKLCYIMGFLKGEGSTSLGKSNYRRLTITNSEPKILKQVLDELDNAKLFKKEKLINKSINLLHHTKSENKVINHWSKKLDLPKAKFKCFDDERKTSRFGVCHIYISDVLLRRVIDLIHNKFLINVNIKIKK